MTQVTVPPLLGNHVENIIAEDENGTPPLNYQVFGDGILVYVNNAGVVNVSYYTPDLTSKEGLVWTLNISVDEPFTVILPENAVIVDLSDIPLDISGDEITMPPPETRAFLTSLSLTKKRPVAPESLPRGKIKVGPFYTALFHLELF
ncbi:hypothetical protein [Thermococcus peptonophilus]|uniref:hypothetical protein n=1 Tax=Thermococcus peptonophilus TaxID=53952 RepID=UPI000A4D3388